MIFLKKHKQQGATLLVGMIMMVVLTLLVVFSLRSGNTNLRIAGNMQTQAEAAAATQQVIEQVIEQIKVTE
ncbi:MAG: pilus assembly PilX family protein, partial [Polaromonas sp.]